LLPWYEAAQFLQVYPLVPNDSQLAQILGDVISRVLAGEMSPKEALTTATDKYRPIIDDFWANVEGE